MLRAISRANQHADTGTKCLEAVPEPSTIRTSRMNPPPRMALPSTKQGRVCMTAYYCRCVCACVGLDNPCIIWTIPTRWSGRRSTDRVVTDTSVWHTVFVSPVDTLPPTHTLDFLSRVEFGPSLDSSIFIG